MPRIEVYGRPHHRRENGRIVRYEKGQRFDGSARELRNMKDRLREVGKKPEPADSEGQGTDDDSNTDELTKAQLIKMAEDLGVEVNKNSTKAEIKEVIDEAIASM